MNRELKAVGKSKDFKRRGEPRWPNLVAMIAVAGLHAALPPDLVLAGPRWLLAAVIAGLVVPLMVSHRTGNHALNNTLGYVLNAVVTVALITSLVLLLSAVTQHNIAPPQLLRSAAALWIANFLVFASWYWHLDAGG